MLKTIKLKSKHQINKAQQPATLTEKRTSVGLLRRALVVRPSKSICQNYLNQNGDKNGNKMVKEMDPIIFNSVWIKLVSKWYQVGPMASMVPQFCAKIPVLKLDGLYNLVLLLISTSNFQLKLPTYYIIHKIYIS